MNPKRIKAQISDADSPVYETLKGILLEEMLTRLQTKPQVRITDPTEIAEYLQLGLSEEKIEYFGVIWLDQQHRVIADDRLFTGTIDTCYVHKRELVKAALQRDACAAILYHNHPSHTPTFSRTDETLTDAVKSALSAIDVRVLDHILVCGKSWASMAQKGLL